MKINEDKIMVGIFVSLIIFMFTGFIYVLCNREDFTYTMNRSNTKTPFLLKYYVAKKFLGD